MKKRTLYISLAFVVGIVYRLLMGMQGFDCIDMGFCMTFYQNIFTHPDALPFYFTLYLTGVVGGVWELLLGSWGVMGSRLFEVLTEAAAIAFMYGAFRPWLKTTGMAVTAIVVSFLFPTLFICFHYDTLSFLLMAASIYAFMRWRRSESLFWLGMAGICLGINFFARIVNGVLWALVLIPFFIGCRQSWKRGWTNAVAFAGGIMAGCLMVVTLMVCLGHWEYFLDAVGSAFNIFSGDENTHSSSNLLGAYFKSFTNILLQMLCLMAVAVAYRYVQRLSPSIKKVLSALLFVVLFVLVYTSNPYLSAIAACTLLLVLTLWPAARARCLGMDVPWDYLMVGAYALGCAYLFPFGSDIGIQGIFNRCGGLLIVPATCCWQWLDKKWQRQMVGAACICVGVSMVLRTALRPYGERSPRWETTEIALPGTVNIMTDSERTSRYRNVVARIAQYDEGNQLLLIGNQAAELYYATRKLPFTGNTNLDAYEGTALVKMLEKRQAHYGGLPIVVFIQDEEDDERVKRFRETVRPWMEQQHYQSAYQDADVEIFTPTKQ